MLLTSRVGPASLRNVTSMGRLAALAAASTGIDLLPIPMTSSRNARAAAAATSPSARDRGWGAGSPGGSLAFSPRESNVPHEQRSASLKIPTVTYVDSHRRLPVGVAFHSVENDVVVGVAREGALLGFTDALRNVPSAFTVTALEPRTQIVLIPGRYLVLAPESKKSLFVAPVKDKSAMVASEESFARLDAMCMSDGAPESAILTPAEAHQPRGLTNILKDCVHRFASLGIMLKRENNMASRVALASMAEAVMRKSGKAEDPGSRTRAACERSIVEVDRVSSLDPYLPATVSFVRKTLFTVFQRLHDRVETHNESAATDIDNETSATEMIVGIDDDGSSYCSSDEEVAMPLVKERVAC
jgi:hypothetical protein